MSITSYGFSELKKLSVNDIPNHERGFAVVTGNDSNTYAEIVFVDNDTICRLTDEKKISGDLEGWIPI